MFNCVQRTNQCGILDETWLYKYYVSKENKFIIFFLTTRHFCNFCPDNIHRFHNPYSNHRKNNFLLHYDDKRKVACNSSRVGESGVAFIFLIGLTFQSEFIGHSFLTAQRCL